MVSGRLVEKVRIRLLVWCQAMHILWNHWKDGRFLRP
jgi:hypothetical protein